MTKKEMNKKKRRETFSSFFKLKLRGILMKRCYYMCVRLCGVYVRGVLYPVERCFNILKNLTENQLVNKLPLPVVCAK